LIKNKFPFFLCLLLLLLCLFAFSASAEALNDNDIMEMEFQRAVALGFMPDTCVANPDDKITYQEFCQAVTALVQQYKPENMALWEEYSREASTSGQVMERDDAAVGLLYASLALDCCFETMWDFPEMKLVERQPESKAYDATPELWPELPGYFRMHEMVPGMPAGTDSWHSTGSTMDTAFRFVLLRFSSKTEFRLLQWDEAYNLRMDEDCTRKEAMLGLIRLLESTPNLVEGNHYISVFDATTYDQTIITPELLNAPSDLPQPTQAELTSQWRGIGITKNKETNHYQEFQEADIAFLAENGLNFTRIFLDLSSLRYPDYPAALAQINETELRDLDQLIAWGIEYGVHIQICAHDTPTKQLEFLDLNEAEWKYYRAYWEALARRYAGIPSRYLSFDLINEMQPHAENIDYATEQMRTVVETLRAADPDRILLISFHNNPDMRWVENMASLGLALSNHPYRPHYFCAGYEEGFPHRGEMNWPYPYFPHRMPAGEKLTVSGEIGNRVIKIYFCDWVGEPFQIAFDNGETRSVDPLVDGTFSGELGIVVPEDANMMTLSCTQDLCFKEIGVVGARSWLVPHDSDCGTANLHWTKKDGWSSEKVIDADYLYRVMVEPVQKLAKEYGVGYMVNEAGNYASGSFHNSLDVSLKAKYDGDLFRCLQEKGISWNMCELYTMSAHIGHKIGWANTVTETKYFYSDDGSRRSITYCTEVMDVYRELVME